MSYSMYEPHQMNGDLMSPPMMSNMHQMADPYGLQQQQAAGANSFRLHQPFVSFLFKTNIFKYIYSKHRQSNSNFLGHK